MYGRGTRRRPGSGRIINVYSKQKSEARLSEFAKAQKHKAESLSLLALVITSKSDMQTRQTKAESETESKGCRIQFLNRLAYTKSAQNKDQRSDG